MRGNATEVLALAGRAHGGQGVDATDDPEQAAAPALSLASRLGAVVAVSGGVDVLTDGTRTRRVHNSSAMLPRVTGSGCALGGLMAAFLSVSADPLDAAVAATAVLTVAGERAEARTPGPGSFAAALLDELYALSPDRLDEEARLS